MVNTQCPIIHKVLDGALNVAWYTGSIELNISLVNIVL